MFSMLRRALGWLVGEARERFDVRGTILQGFSAPAIDRALGG